MDFQLNLNVETIERALPTQPLLVETYDSVRHALRLMQAHRDGSVLVCLNRVLVGIFTERDALKLLAADSDLDSPIEEVMTRGPVTVRPSDTVATAIRKMSFGGFRRLPVVDKFGRPIGLIKASRIVRYMVEHFSKSVYNLPPEPHAMMQEREGA